MVDIYLYVIIAADARGRRRRADKVYVSAAHHEQKIEGALDRAVKAVVLERAPDGIARIVELLGGLAPSTQGELASARERIAEQEQQLADARARIDAQEQQLTEAAARFKVLKRQLEDAVCRTAPGRMAKS